MKALDRLRVLTRLHDLRDRPDAELVRLFADRRDEAAFELLVRRHGPLVLGVCRRALGDASAADDAFQATFLLLARRAPGLRQPAGVANWLYGTAARTAREALRHERRRRRRERLAAKPESVVAYPDDTSALIDAAVRRLPEPYRSAVLLCDLSGLSRDQAAAELGVPPGTVASRLSRGRALLGEALTRQGVTLSAGLVIVVPADLAARTVRLGVLLAAGEAAVPAAVGVLLTYGGRTMLPIGLWKVAVGLLAAGGLAVVGAGGHKPAEPPAAAKPAAKEPTPAERLAKLRAEYEAEDKAGVHKGKDQRTGEVFDIHTTIPPAKYMPRLLELGRGGDEPTAAAALCWAVSTWQNPEPAESEEAFRLFLERFAAGPLCLEYARGVIAVPSYGDGWERVRRVLEVAADRPARGMLELKQAHMANPRRGGRWHAEVTVNLALRRDTALALYDRIAAEYPDLDGGKLATTAKREAAKLRDSQDLPGLPKLPAKP